MDLQGRCAGLEQRQLVGEEFGFRGEDHADELTAVHEHEGHRLLHRGFTVFAIGAGTEGDAEDAALLAAGGDDAYGFKAGECRGIRFQDICIAFQLADHALSQLFRGQVRIARGGLHHVDRADGGLHLSVEQVGVCGHEGKDRLLEEALEKGLFTQAQFLDLALDVAPVLDRVAPNVGVWQGNFELPGEKGLVFHGFLVNV